MAKSGPPALSPVEFAVAFWKRVSKAGPILVPALGRCWVWTGGTVAPGYGQVQARAIHPAPMLSHRISWELAYGPIPAGTHVLHKCDNPVCVRPSHLFLGTQADNNADRVAKGRTASGDRNGARTRPERNPFIRNGGSGLKGEKHPAAKLTDEQVAEMKQEYAAGARKRHLARKYGVSETHAGRILNGKNRR